MDQPTPTPDPIYINRDVNRKAIQQTIKWSEGTLQIPNSDNGYRALVGGKTFDNYAKHPNIPIWIPRISQYSTAAGAYQIIYKFWWPYVDRLGLTDFSPPMQDRYMVEVDLREVGVLDDVDAGRFEIALQKCGKRWASLPGSPYGQTIRTVDQCKQIYLDAGGIISA